MPTKGHRTRQLRLAPAEHEEIEARAARNGMEPNEWIKARLGLRATKRIAAVRARSAAEIAAALGRKTDPTPPRRRARKAEVS